MQDINKTWALIFIAQLTVGMVCLFYGVDDAAVKLGYSLVGGAFAQGVTANMKATT